MRCAIVSLLVVLGVFTFETGVHAVHHLGHIDEPDRSCSLAGAAQMDAVTSADPAPPLLALVPLAAVVDLAPVAVLARATSLPAERAPPPSSAA
jgi:hypothetical protein